MRTGCRSGGCRVGVRRGLAAKAFAPASCLPSSLRRVNISQVHQTCEMFRLKQLIASKQHAYLEIADTGPGITQNDLPHVFDRFFRADSVRHETAGAGLGLSIVQSICAAHGGLVRAENQSTGGCRITVQLPLAT